MFAYLLQNGMARAPLLTPIRSVSVNLTGSVVSEGQPTPASRIVLASNSLTPRAALALIVLTSEAVAGTSPAALAFIETELQKAVASAADGSFLSAILSGVTPIPASGNDAEAALADLRAMLNVVNVKGAGALHWIVPPDVANAAATLTSLAGAFTFPNMSPVGGEMLGLNALVSDSVAPGTVVLLDAGGVVGDIQRVEIQSSENAAIQMRDDPEGAASTLVSMFQTNSVALLARLVFGLERYRANAAAALTGVTWGGPAS